ncbi:hypothetical protein [Pseudalkalibacillus decolorationis]|uniref:hypothetical protein n=1 Tax=Pseudalkalibacillus decolorationis TaxID=163879 RepID=UPI002148B843|nr:hypothetical protein [Pseudalkalibacillus decolorationis]
MKKCFALIPILLIIALMAGCQNHTTATDIAKTHSHSSQKKDSDKKSKPNMTQEEKNQKEQLLAQAEVNANEVSLDQLKKDTFKWKQEVEPIVGPTDTIIFRFWQ